MDRKKIALPLAAALLVAAVVVYLLARGGDADELVLHGNVDIRQVELPFADSERIAAVFVREGERVRAGQTLARLETARLEARLQGAEARAAAQAEVLRRLENGARPEEIAQARAALASARAEAANARSHYERLQSVARSSEGRAVSELDLEAGRAALDVSEAQVESSRKALELMLAGAREEDIAQARAELEAARAEVALLKRQLEDAELRAPTDAVVRSRLMEPGELATPQRPVFSLAVTDPKWVRAYAPEWALGRLRLGAAAAVITDSFPDEPLDGELGFISSVAEFTPKTVQTEDLRTSLVYEVRVFVNDPAGRLRLGMPATVRFDLSDAPPASAASR
jgi:HlyD family secretion protein